MAPDRQLTACRVALSLTDCLSLYGDWEFIPLYCASRGAEALG